jgi:hypothetical protein
MKAWIQQLDRILRGEATKPPALREGLRIPVCGLTVVLVVLAAIHGVCVGAFAVVRTGGGAWPQMIASAVKIPMLFFLTLIVTFPSLYVFNALMGSRVTIASAFRLLMVAMAVLVTSLASLGPIVAFFAVSTTSYSFMVVLNVAAGAVAGLLGLIFLLRTLHRMVVVQEESEWSAAAAPAQPAAPSQPGPFAQPAPLPGDSPEGPPRGPAVPPLPAPVFFPSDLATRRVRGVFYVWCVVFALVGSQMSWVLRPFIGDPNRPFEFFRQRQGNFFEAVAGALRHVLGG